MGQKTRPTGFRVGITEPWRSRWYAQKREFGDLLIEDKKIRDHIKAKNKGAGIAMVVIERTRDNVVVHLHSSRPGILIGQKGQNVDRVKAELEDLTGRRMDVKIVEIANANRSAVLVAEAQIGRQGPHAVGIIGGVARIGVDLRCGDELEARRFGEPPDGRDLQIAAGPLARAVGAFGKPVIDLSANEPAVPISGAAFPSLLQTTSVVETPAGERQFVNLNVSQFRSDDETPGVGTVRRFTSVKGRALYAPTSSGDGDAPTVISAETAVTGSDVHFDIRASDDAATTRVVVMYVEGTSWKRVDLDYTFANVVLVKR